MLFLIHNSISVGLGSRSLKRAYRWINFRHFEDISIVTKVLTEVLGSVLFPVITA